MLKLNSGSGLGIWNCRETFHWGLAFHWRVHTFTLTNGRPFTIAKGGLIGRQGVFLTNIFCRQMWLKCQLCRTIALNLVLSKKKRKSELDRKVPNSTFWTRGLAANPDNLSNPALIIPSLEHSIVIELSHLIELISEMWLRFPRFLPAVPSSDIFVVYPLRARNPPWQLDSHTGGKICQREITASWNLQMCCCGNPKRSVGQIRACKGWVYWVG